MATFVQIEPDAFNKVFSTVAQVQGQGQTFDASLGDQAIGLYHHVRRPVRGIQIKDDTYATIQVRQSNGIAIPLFDAGSPNNTGKGIRNSNFLIQSIQESRAEKQQVVLTFGEPYLFLFGEQPRVINVSGVLLNTEDFNWRAEWWQNYDLYLRGTQCVRLKARAYLSWDDIVVEGYMIQANAQEEQTNRNLVQFSFQMFLTNYQNISSIGDINAHWEGKDINLDPDSIDLPGTTDTSTTSLVRSANLYTQMLASGGGSDSLIDSLRNGLASAASTVVQIQGQIVDLLSLAGQFISGRNIRVPVGFTGAAAFDGEVQVAIDSIPGAADIIDGTGNRTIGFTTGSSLVPEFRAALGSKFGPALVGLPLSANTDEYVARVQQDDTGAVKFNNLFVGQTAEDDDALDKVQEAYDEFGIDTDPPSSLTSLFARAAFGIVSISGANPIQNSASLRATLSVI